MGQIFLRLWCVGIILLLGPTKGFCGVSDAELDQIHTVTKRLKKLCPPRECTLLSIGRSPTPFQAYIESGAHAPNYLFNVPLSSFRYGVNEGSSPLSTAEEQKLFKHFEQFVPDIEKLNKEKILIVDYGIHGESLVSAQNYFKKFLKIKGLDQKIDAVLITNAETAYQVHPDIHEMILLKGRTDLNKNLDRQRYDDLSPFGSYYVRPELDKHGEKNDASPEKGPESVNPKYEKFLKEMAEKRLGYEPRESSEVSYWNEKHSKASDLMAKKRKVYALRLKVGSPEFEAEFKKATHEEDADVRAIVPEIFGKLNFTLLQQAMKSPYADIVQAAVSKALGKAPLSDELEEFRRKSGLKKGEPELLRKYRWFKLKLLLEPKMKKEVRLAAVPFLFSELFGTVSLEALKLALQDPDRAVLDKILAEYEKKSDYISLQNDFEDESKRPPGRMSQTEYEDLLDEMDMLAERLKELKAKEIPCEGT